MKLMCILKTICEWGVLGVGERFVEYCLGPYVDRVKGDTRQGVAISTPGAAAVPVPSF